MKRINQKTLIIAALFSMLICSCRQSLFVPYTNPKIAYSGRIDTSDRNYADLYWSGTTIKMNFEGTSVSALMDDERGDNYYNIIIDHADPVLLRPDTTKHFYQLASGLAEGEHAVEIFKRTEWDRGKTSFYGFKINGNPKVLPGPEPKKRKIEFYGNSITAGYAVEDTSGKDRPDSSFTNNYLSYSRITADHFNAEYSCICKSGIGITISWFPLIMPEMYNRLIPEDPNSRWDFSLYTPDVVVINLLQNDSWLVNMPDHDSFKLKFGAKKPDDDFIIQAYCQFVKSIREAYPEAQIICMLGTMDATREGSQWPEVIKQAVSELSDPGIYTLFIPFKNTPGHPSIAEQQEMAGHLIQFIEENIE